MLADASTNSATQHEDLMEADAQRTEWEKDALEMLEAISRAFKKLSS